MRRYRIEYESGFVKSLADIEDYISRELGNPVASRRLVEDIIKHCKMLRIFPKGSAVRMRIRGKELRFTYVRSYTIVFSVDDESRTVMVHMVQYSRSDIEALLD